MCLSAAHLIMGKKRESLEMLRLSAAIANLFSICRIVRELGEMENKLNLWNLNGFHKRDGSGMDRDTIVTQRSHDHCDLGKNTNF